MLSLKRYKESNDLSLHDMPLKRFNERLLLKEMNKLKALTLVIVPLLHITLLSILQLFVLF